AREADSPPDTGRRRPVVDHVNGIARFVPRLVTRVTGTRSEVYRLAGGVEERLDLIDSLVGVAIPDVDERSRVGSVEEQVAHEVCALRVGRTQTLHQVAHHPRHAVGEALRHQGQVL